VRKAIFQIHLRSKRRIAGRVWVEGFLRRNPLIESRKAQYLNPGRTLKFNCFIFYDYFANL
jgi:hypothetical protein